MSKFDNVYKKISEALPTMPTQQQNQPNQNQPNQNQQQTPQQQQQAVQQAAKLLNMDPKILQQILDTQKQQQANKPTTQTTTQQPAV